MDNDIGDNYDDNNIGERAEEGSLTIINDDDSEESPLFEQSKQNKINRKKFKKQNQNVNTKKKYKAQYPQPSYSNFGKAEFVDLTGREYKLAKKMMIGEDPILDMNSISLNSEKEWGTQIFWIKIPIWQRKSIGFPEAENEKITFYDPKTQVIATGTTDGVFHGSKAATGYIVLRNFMTLGQTSEPQEYEYLVDKNLRPIELKRDLF